MPLRNTAVGDDIASEQMDSMFQVAFCEDKEILEAVHEQEKRLQKRRPIRIAIDKAPSVYRKRIRDLIAAESTLDLGEPVDAVFIQHD
jgi:vanillate O-demethylase monooxygenase subunit